jgi:hypothetical protein
MVPTDTKEGKHQLGKQFSGSENYPEAAHVTPAHI